MSDYIDLQIGTPQTIRSESTLTASYASATVFSMANHNSIGLTLDYNKGDETSTELKVETSNDGGTTYAQTVNESRSSGTTTVSLEERAFSATGTYGILVNPVRAKLVKVSVKATGGTPTGTASITAVPLWS